MPQHKPSNTALRGARGAPPPRPARRAARSAGGRRWRRRRRRDVAAAQDQAAPVADVEHRLLAVVAANLPVHQRLVVRRFLRVVDDLAGKVIEQDRLPSGRLERQLRRRGVAVGRAVAGAAALALRERGRRPNRHGDAERLQQLTARDPAAIERMKQPRKIITHRTSSGVSSLGMDRSAASSVTAESNVDAGAPVR